MKAISRIYVALMILFLYAPVAVMIFFSFNSGASVWIFERFSFDWYKGILFDTSMMEGLRHTITVALLSAGIATVLGTAAAVGILALRRKITRSFVTTVTNIPMMNADIVTGVSL
ncbi:MAG: hypothetical protein J6T73_04725, partial [Clostridia bacterium]|nr:hypothetical protein [Clostridia bacterium]